MYTVDTSSEMGSFCEDFKERNLRPRASLKRSNQILVGSRSTPDPDRC